MGEKKVQDNKNLRKRGCKMRMRNFLLGLLGLLLGIALAMHHKKIEKRLWEISKRTYKQDGEVKVYHPEQ